MSTKKPYWEKLKDPRWQKKRLLMLERSEWTCEVCGGSENTLHVHHKQYLKGREPWEYEEGQLIVLCEECHSLQHLEEDFLNYVASFAPIDGPLNRRELGLLIAGILELFIDCESEHEGNIYDLGVKVTQEYRAALKARASAIRKS